MDQDVGSAGYIFRPGTAPPVIRNTKVEHSFLWKLFFLQTFTFLACVQTITKLWLVPSAKQRRDPCSGPPTDSTNYQKCVSNSPSTWLAITTNKTKPFLTGQLWRVLKSGYTAGSPEQGFWRCFADGANQSLISSARRLSHSRNTYRRVFFSSDWIEYTRSSKLPPTNTKCFKY